MKSGFLDDDPQVAVTALLVDFQRVIGKLEDGIQRTYFHASQTAFA